MHDIPSDHALAPLLNAPAPTTIADVITMMEHLDTAFPSHDGLKWFNLLYLTVTKRVRDHPLQQGWADRTWLTHLDVTFAHRYFVAIAHLVHQAAPIPSAWQALFEARHRTGIDRIQFALAGMNAHINHDLPLALVETNHVLRLTPTLHSPEHQDFENVNTILDALIPEVLHFLATGILVHTAVSFASFFLAVPFAEP